MNSLNEKSLHLTECLRHAARVVNEQGAQSVNPGVAAVVTVEKDATYLPATLEAVFRQTVLPAELIIADCSADTARSGVEHLNVAISPMNLGGTQQGIEVQIVPVKGASSFGDAVSAAIAAGSVRSTVSYLWLLHDDSRPVSRRGLEMLLEADRNAPGAKLIGAKQVEWDEEGLQNVGYFVSRNHRRASLVVEGEEDQDQYDDRQDVYGVSLAGALVSLATWQSLSGTDAWYGTFGESMDFARRVYLSGGRVIVAPKVIVAHRKARFNGVRSNEGEAVEGDPRSSYDAQVVARDRFVSTETAVWKKPFLWLWSILVSLGLFVMNLFAKKPYEAVCELSSPWRTLFRLPQAMAARSRLHSLAKEDHSRFSSLIVTSAQLREWKQRKKVFAAQHNGVILSPLELDYLRSLSKRCALWIALLCVIGISASLAMYWPLIGGIFAGSSVYSSILAPTAASLSIVARSATTMWSFSWGLGAVAAPLPFNLVLLILSVITGGHLATGIGVFILLAPLFAMLSFWGLAGVMTRSNPLRFTMAIAWGVLPAVLGIYQTAHVPMLMVFVFLPLSFFFVFRAVGMYAVDRPRTAHSSVQAAAMAGLTMAFVALSEPQLAIPFLIVFAAFLVVVRSHRAMLLLMPLPSIVLLIPTFFSVLIHFQEGLWRQLFVDAVVPDQGLQGIPSNNGLFQLLTIQTSSLFSATGWEQVVVWVMAVVAALIVLCAVVSLFVPHGFRVSRMAWLIVLGGGILGSLASRVAVGLDAGTPVAASILPAVVFVSLGILLAACAVSGRQDSTLVLSVEEVKEYKRTGFSRVVRVGLAIVLGIGSALGAVGVGAGWNSSASVSVMSDDGLPLIASQDLNEKEGARIFALTSDMPNNVEYSVMRTPAGDVVDINATTQISDMLGASEQEDSLREIAARLLSANDDEAVANLTKMGFTGIYVPASSSASRANLAAHVTASNGTEQVVNNTSGLYVRLTSASSETQHIDVSAEKASYSDPLRIVWLVVAGIVVAAYLIVAIPRTRSFVQEED